MKPLLLNALLAIACLAQVRPAGSDSPNSNLPAHKIGANDLLSLSVYDAPELSRMVRVSEDGYIRLPMLKSRINVAGAMPVEVEERIATALQDEQILVEPFVTVTIADYSSRPVNVAGAVKQPKTFQVVGSMRLLDAISSAGGLSEAAGADILVSVPGQPTQRIPVKGLLESSDAAYNLVLNGGEDIRVMEAGKAFVVGNVRRPGAFALRGVEQSSILQMLALAEGLAPFASKQAYIYRRGSDGVRQEIAVELRSILARKQPDVAVLSDDVLYIPENSGRKLSIAAVEKALMFGTNAGSTALIYATR